MVLGRPRTRRTLLGGFVLIELLKLGSDICVSILPAVLFGVPAIISGIKEWNDIHYPKRFCALVIILGILMCVGPPAIIYTC